MKLSVCQGVQVVPGSLWELIEGMVVICTHQLKPLRPRVEISQLRDAAQLEQRAALVDLAARIAAFADGIHKIDRCVSNACMPLALCAWVGCSSLFDSRVKQETSLHASLCTACLEPSHSKFLCHPSAAS